MNYKRFITARPVDIATKGSGTDVIREKGIKKLLATLGDSYWHARAGAGLSLGKSRHKDAMEAILRLTEDGNLSVRMATAVALGICGNKEAVPHLLSLLESKKTATSIAAGSALSLGLLGDPSATDRLIKTARTAKNLDLRATALVGLGLSGDRRAMPTLEKLLFEGRENKALLSMAVWAYAQIVLKIPKEKPIKTKAGIAKLLLLMGSKHKEVRQAVAAALADIPGGHVHMALERASLKDGDGRVRGNALMALAWRSRGGEPVDAIHLFPVAFGREKNAERRGYAVVAAGLSRAPEMGDWVARIFRTEKSMPLRCAAALALGLGRFNGAADLLRPHVLGDNTPYELRRWASIGLGLTGDRRSTPALARILIHGVPKTKREGKGRQTYIRYCAAQALALSGDPSAVGPLEKALTDRNPTLRGASAAALGPYQSSTSIQALSDAIDREKVGDLRADFASALGNVLIDKAVRYTLSQLPRGFSVPAAKRFGLLYLLLTLE
jgi:HEAT repeat protein